MKRFRILTEIIPRISILLILVPLLLETWAQIPLISLIPRLVIEGRLDIASMPILLLVSLTSCLATLAIPSPSLYTLTVFFASLVTLPKPPPRGNLLASIGLYQAIAVLFVILVSDVLRNHYRRAATSSITRYEADGRDVVKGFLLFLIMIAIIPGIVSIYVASYIFLFKLHSVNPYVSPIVSFLDNNPAGSVLMASILLGVFYMLARQAIEVAIFYINPSPKIALMDLSSSVDLKWVRPPLGSMRGFVLSAVITPPVYYIVAGTLRAAGLVARDDQLDLLSRVALWVVGLAMFIAIWSILSRSIFSEEREPTLRNTAILIAVVIGIYVISYLAGLSMGFPTSPGLDNMLNPLVSYYRDTWIIIELVMRAIGAAP